MEKNEDTVNLLRECSSGCKLAADSISGALGKTNDVEFNKVLQNYYGRHMSITADCGKLLNQYGCPDKDAQLMAKAMSKVKTEIKMSFSDNASTAAKLMIDGCSMGIKSVGGYLNKYKNANTISKNLANDILDCEKQFTSELVKFL